MSGARVAVYECTCMMLMMLRLIWHGRTDTTTTEEKKSRGHVFF
jgi:hypothetical protein